MSEEPNAKDTVGCIFGLFTIILVTPVWYALLFGILQAIEAEPWMWVCYFIYVPAQLGCAILGRLFQEMRKA